MLDIHTHNRCRRRDKKASKVVVCLEKPASSLFHTKNSRTDLGCQDRIGRWCFFSFSLQVLWPVFPCQNGSKNLLHVVKSWISKKSTSPPPLTNQTKKKSWRQYVSSSGPNRMEQKKSGQGGGGGRVADGRWFQ
jgi:hypothetical protein